MLLHVQVWMILITSVLINYLQLFDAVKIMIGSSAPPSVGFCPPPRLRFLVNTVWKMWRSYQDTVVSPLYVWRCLKLRFPYKISKKGFCWKRTIQTQHITQFLFDEKSNIFQHDCTSQKAGNKSFFPSLTTFRMLCFTSWGSGIRIETYSLKSVYLDSVTTKIVYKMAKVKTG